MRKKKYRRSLEEIMASPIVDLWTEAPQKYPCSAQRFAQLARENRLHTFDSPRKAFCDHIEAQMAAGFPVLEQERQTA